MTHVVCQPCENCKYTDCVVVCPVTCFYEGETMLYIHPDECIDCGACEPACPVEAIYAVDDLPSDKTKWEKINTDKCEAGDLEVITEAETPLPTADAKKAALRL